MQKTVFQADDPTTLLGQKFLVQGLNGSSDIRVRLQSTTNKGVKKTINAGTDNLRIDIYGVIPFPGQTSDEIVSDHAGHRLQFLDQKDPQTFGDGVTTLDLSDAGGGNHGYAWINFLSNTACRLSTDGDDGAANSGDELWVEGGYDMYVVSVLNVGAAWATEPLTLIMQQSDE